MNAWLRQPLSMWRSRRAYLRMMESFAEQYASGLPLHVSASDWCACWPYASADFARYMTSGDGRLLTAYGPAEIVRDR